MLTSLELHEDASTYGVDFRTGYPAVRVYIGTHLRRRLSGPIFQYMNDLDKDPQYREWGNSVKLMIQPYFPGMIRPIARNFFTLVSAHHTL